MQYIKLGRIKIPYEIKKEGTQKKICIYILKLPYEVFEKNEKKYYKIGFLKFNIPFFREYLVTSGQYHYSIKEQLTEKKIIALSKEIFRQKVGYNPDFETPRSMNEKIFWLKFHYKNPMVTKCCDKFCVKDYVKEVLGNGYTIPTLMAWDDAEKIDFSLLPHQCVLKVNWASGYNIILKDLTTVDIEEVKKQLSYWMRPEQNSYYQTFNWGYKYMKPMIYAEPYLEQIDGQLFDYKFFCCNGKVRFWFIATDRYTNKVLTHDFFDTDFKQLPFDYGGRGHASEKLKKPKFYEQMIQCAEKLSAPFPFVRVDFYEVDDVFYVGEMTFYPGGGILPFTPREWDYKLGEYIQLPNKGEENEQCHQITEEQGM